MKALLDRYLAPTLRRVRLSIGLALIDGIDDSGGVQTAQVRLLRGEVGRARRYQHFGFSSHPPAGSPSVTLAVGGHRSHLVIVADDGPGRIRDLAPGEVALYTADGTTVVCRVGGRVEITAATEVLVDAPLLRCTGDVADAAGTMQEMRDTFNAHTHAGVQTGSGSTAVPSQVMS